MHTQRNRWLAGLSNDEFAGLSVWEFISHPESRQQWIAEIRARLATRQTDIEILSTLYLGLHYTVTKAIERHRDAEPDRRGLIVIGSALAFIRKEGIASVFSELPGHDRGCVISLDACIDAHRSHGLEHDYFTTNTDYIESLPVTPQFLADEQAVPDLLFQERHTLCESIKHHLTPRETQVLRLMVIDTIDADDISEILDVSKRQVWKIQRELKLKLIAIAKESNVDCRVLTCYERTIKK